MNILASMRYLVALDEHKHFGRAAQACHVTQPALSNALRALEEEFGTVIVKRSRAYAGLTPEGERVLATAQRMLNERELLRQELSSSSEQPHGTLRLGAVPTAMPILARFSALLHARHPGILPVVRSMSSPDIETGLDSLSLDLGLGYTDRLGKPGMRLSALPQYTEHYFLLRRRDGAPAAPLQIGAPMTWAQAGALRLCLLTPEMHNRTLIDNAFAAAGVQVTPAIETNSIFTLMLSVVAGDVCSVLPGALVDAARGYPGLEALPLAAPEVRTPIGFMTAGTDRPSRTLQAALVFAADPEWLAHAAAHSGLLGPAP